MPGYEVLEELGHGRRLVRFTDGPQTGSEVVLVPRPIPGVSRVGYRHAPPPLSQRAERRAEALLVSLLNDDQRADWCARHRFVVDTPYGTVEFGELYDLRFVATSGGEYRLCVLPKGATGLPEGDVWSNLLLFIQRDPKWFFTVANWRRPHGEWTFGPVPGIQQR